MTKYRTSAGGLIIVYVLLIVLIQLYDYAGLKTLIYDLIILFVLFLVPILFSYIELDRQTKTLTQHNFLVKRSVDIRSIVEISQQPTYKIAKGTFKSIYVIYQVANEVRWLKINPAQYGSRTIERLVADLKAVNPGIKVDYPSADAGKAA